MIFVRSVGGSIIKDVNIKVADKEDLLSMLGLESLGMKRTMACVITFLKDLEERSSRDIEVATGLSQPTVNIVMETLKERNWLTEHEIINYCEAEKSRELARTSEAIQKLKDLSSA